jgi:hypothetical protein
MWPFRSYRLGKLKNLTDVTIEDFRRHHIWVCDLSGEGKKGHDETSIRPLLEEADITPRLARRFASLEFLTRLPSTDVWGSASYFDKASIRSVGFWVNGGWHRPGQAGLAAEGLIFEVVPRFGGAESVQFAYNTKTGGADRVARSRT